MTVSSNIFEDNNGNVSVVITCDASVGTVHKGGKRDNPDTKTSLEHVLGPNKRQRLKQPAAFGTMIFEV